jgi:hypothetical protein
LRFRKSETAKIFILFFEQIATPTLSTIAPKFLYKVSTKAQRFEEIFGDFTEIDRLRHQVSAKRGWEIHARSHFGIAKVLPRVWRLLF